MTEETAELTLEQKLALLAEQATAETTVPASESTGTAATTTSLPVGPVPKQVSAYANVLHF